MEKGQRKCLRKTGKENKKKGQNAVLFNKEETRDGGKKQRMMILINDKNIESLFDTFNQQTD